ncbi:sigma-54-dependent Fis family transcriptional regulator [Streptomyces yaanensis]|uniref:Sigma-54-dependent Fis family transcriptional regulator n=1 Tax=Streptomyces yaanensis TaxID=1142239 RepID=A0ABV7S8U3_9ACTN|nr:helix-turn-helix domain-containing protein [Streptomyces sp. CGMCC 4.7035]WNC00243.1 helix-turn-helix domain-containing protein [Streptomyces sp. CGMCC 4.7035]
MTTAEPSPVGPALVGPALAPLRLARERFLSGRPLPEGVPEEVVAAWRRARFFGVPHDLAEGSARPERPEESSLLGAARPVLERIASALDAGRSVLVLTDERLRVLWTAGNVPGPSPLHDLSEQEVGHNSAVLALRTRRRAEVHGPEHFLDRWQNLSAVSVPVLAPGSGQALGTVTVASELCPAGCPPHPGAALAEAAVTAVEAELLARARRAERVLLDAYLRAAQGQDRAVAVLDGRNRLVSATAERMLTSEGLAALERAAVALRHRDVPADAVLPEGAGCTALVTPVRHEGAVIGVVAELEPSGDPAPPAPCPPLSLAGSSVPWRYAVGRAAELARSREPLLLTGERGTGKTALARELLGEHAARVVDAAEDGRPDQAYAELTDGRPLLLRHAERLAQPGVAALNSLLDAHPDAPLVVTYTPGTPPGPCLQRLLDTLAARAVTLPALRERPEDIPELLSALAPRPAPGLPPLTWTLDALRALERYPWPGNVTEFAHTVRALAEHRRASGPVQRAELPDAVREGPAARYLSPMENAERKAILEALRRHGGNKARTAAALGIGRATLYRKLRGYRG